MTPERWAQVAELLEGAVAVPRAHRDAWLLEHADDESLRAEVRELLAVYDRDPEYLEHPADPRPVTEQADLDAHAGHQVGAYRLTREIGRGGMGVVYEAVRADQAFDRRAAVKMLPAWSAAVLAERFRFERRVLASLDHPGIARLLDAGADDAGNPYCVMEYVDGRPIDEWCDARQLDTAGRVGLVVRMCEAVAYAHGHLVVHRDLKPSNILVADDGQPKLLDFGIATLLDAEQGSGANATRTGFTSFTPEFASPEQVRGEKATTANDVYSLGVLLYLLLAGRRPYELRALAPLEGLRVVCEVDPPPPSSVAPTPIAARLRGDVDTIVMKALRKAPADRYATVGDLSADLQAWLDRRPIAAAPASWVYVTRRFVRRHAIGVAATVAAVVAVLAGAATTAWQARVARHERALADARFDDVRQLAKAVAGPLYDAIARVPGSTEARRVLVAEALTYLNRLSSQSGDDLVLIAELADAYEKIGDVQGNPFGTNLNDRGGAEASYARLSALRVRVLRDRPGDPAAVRGMAEADRRIGDLAFGDNHYDGALAAYERAIARLQSLVGSEGDEPSVLALARAHDRVGNVYLRETRYDEAGAAFARALALARPLVRRSGASAAARRFLMASLGNSGDVPYSRGQYAEALTRYEEARAIAREAMQAPVDRASAMRDLQLTTTRSAYALKEMHRLDEGEALERDVVQLLTELVRIDPGGISRRFELAEARRGVALTLLERHRPADAVREAEEAIATFEAAFALGPEPEERFPYALTFGTLGDALRAAQRWPDSAQAFRRALGILDAPDVDARRPSEHPRLQWALGDVLVEWARREGRDDLRREARAAYTQALDGFADLARRGVLEPAFRDASPRIAASLRALP